ncbi:MAG TPA: zf-HC2 domain-containing protein [Pyrinomonadaceae bacterium]|jgi:hypothetical protein
MKNCLDEGTLQAYLDGELSPATMKDAAAHAAACDACADAVREAEAELSMFAAAFAYEDAVVVPSARLRERLDASIAELQPSAPPPHAATMTDAKPNLRQWLATLAASFTLSPARATAFATLAAIVVIGVIIANVRTPEIDKAPTEMASNKENSASVSTTTNVQNANDRDLATSQGAARVPQVVESNGDNAVTSPRRGVGVEMVKASSRQVRAKCQPQTRTMAAESNVAKATDGARPSDEKELALPGEENYLIAIASLNRVIEAGGDVALRPALRADLERNVAELDKAITASRRKAQRNPQDKDAKDFLFAAYQSKVELLTTVADQTQMAALGR